MTSLKHIGTYICQCSIKDCNPLPSLSLIAYSLRLIVEYAAIDNILVTVVTDHIYGDEGEPMNLKTQLCFAQETERIQILLYTNIVYHATLSTDYNT